MRTDQAAIGRAATAPPRAGSVVDAVLRDGRAGIAGLGLLSIGSLVVWIAALLPVDPRAITDIGLISVLPPAAFAALGMLAISFALALRIRPLPQGLLAVQVVFLVVMLAGAPGLFQEFPRFVTAWLHVAFADAIARTGELFPFRDARFDWPAFFVLWAFLSNATGVESLLPILEFAPVVQGILYLLPLYFIASSATGDLRLVWLTLWIFTLGNWVGQDYFSPQGMNILLLLTVVAILLTWFRADPTRRGWLVRVVGWIPFLRTNPVVVDPRGSTDGGPVPYLTTRQQIGLVVAVSLIFGMSVASHQLTPFAMIGGLVLLVLGGRLWPWGVPTLMMVLVSTWLVFMATTFLDGRLAALLADIGRPDQFVEGNVAERLVGSAGHVMVVQGRLIFTLTIWLLAFVGGIRRIRSGRLDLSLALLAVAPFGLVLAQGYGGEMILRVFLFSIPFMAFFLAAAFFPSTRPASWTTSIAVFIVSLALGGGHVFARYGNEKADMVTAEDYAAIAYAKSVAEPGSPIATPNSRVPIEFTRWEEYRYPDLFYYFTEEEIREPEGMAEMLNAINNTFDPGTTMYLVVTRSSRSHAELNWGFSLEEWNSRIAAIEAEFETLYQNREAAVYAWTVPFESAATP